jgi:hypothetical protein
MTNNKNLFNNKNLVIDNFYVNSEKINIEIDDFINFISNHHNISHKEINNIFSNIKRLNPLLKEIIDIKLSGGNETEKFYIYKELISENLIKQIEFSHKNNIYFWCCTSLTYKNTFEDRWKKFENEFIDVEKIDFIKSDYKGLLTLNNYYISISYWNEKILKLLVSSFEKKIQFLDDMLSEFGIKASVLFEGTSVEIDLLYNKPHTGITPQTTKRNTNKSLLFNGKDLNLSERFKIANEVLGIDKKIRTLNIPDLKKYQLLAYILGIDKDNARNLMNGSYKSKDRDLSTYFNDLGLNK